jgi:ABC-2 type transport system ATP-binding protein
MNLGVTSIKNTRAIPIVGVALLVALLAPARQGLAQVGWVVENPVVVTSFDGTRIVATFMLPDEASESNPVPVILQTNGWGTSRPQYPTAFNAGFLDSGYAIFSWDSRGFGESERKTHWNDPNWEVRDVQAILDYLGTREDILQDGPGDPRVGWIGGSYAGSIQWNTAAVEPRIDVITPRASGRDFARDMLPNGVYKFGIFAKSLQKPGRFSRPVVRVFDHLNTSFRLSREERDWLDERSSFTWVPKITTPTLVLAGTVDQAFPLQDALANYKTLLANGAPVKMVAYCGGHGQLCPYAGNDVGDPNAPRGTQPLWVSRLIAWLDRYLKQDPSVDTGAPIEWQAQDGYYYGSDEYPLPPTKVEEGKTVFTGLLGGPAKEASGEARVATRLKIYGPTPKSAPLFGRPVLNLKGTADKGRAYVYMSFLDQAPNGDVETIDEQTVPVTFRKGQSEFRMKFNALSWMLRKGHSIVLQVSTGTPGFRTPTHDRYEISFYATVSLPISKTSPDPVPLP